MREILFRGKRVDNDEWIYGDLVHWWGKHNTKPDIQIYNNVQRFNVIPETVGEYTGLTDKNGKKIFEGDIVRMNGNPLDLAVIRFGEFACVDIELEEKTDRVHGWYFKPIETDGLSRCEPYCWEFQLNEMWIKQTEPEVIGNIHDNPELMKGDNE